MLIPGRSGYRSRLAGGVSHHLAAESLRDAIPRWQCNKCYVHKVIQNKFGCKNEWIIWVSDSRLVSSAVRRA